MPDRDSVFAKSEKGRRKSKREKVVEEEKEKNKFSARCTAVRIERIVILS